MTLPASFVSTATRLHRCVKFSIPWVTLVWQNTNKRVETTLHVSQSAVNIFITWCAHLLIERLSLQLGPVRSGRYSCWLEIVNLVTLVGWAFCPNTEYFDEFPFMGQSSLMWSIRISNLIKNGAKFLHNHTDKQQKSQFQSNRHLMAFSCYLAATSWSESIVIYIPHGLFIPQVCSSQCLYFAVAPVPDS